MRRLRDLSLKHKLIGLIMAVLSGALLIGFAIEMVTDISSYKEELRRSSTVTTRLTAINSEAPLAFDDRAGAQEMLSTLEAVPYIDAAYLYDSALNIFASYAKKDLQSEIARDLLREGSESRFVNGFLHVVQAVSRNGRLYGFVYTMASTRELDARINSTMISVTVLVGCLLIVSYLVTVRLQRIISAPIHNLADVAQQITRDGDYSQRAAKWGSDEIGALYDSFNQMLDQIEARKLERDKAEDALRSSEAKYRAYMDNAPIGVFVIDGSGRIIDANPTLCEFTGYLDQELAKMNIIDLVGETASTPGGNGLMLRLVRAGFEGVEVTIRHQGGKVRHHNLCAAPLSDSRLLVFASDITGLKEAQQELVHLAERLGRSNRELEDFASVASHDLQEPLRKVRAFGDRLRTACGDILTEKASDYLDRMQHAAGRMQVLINDLLTFSRVTTKAQPHVEIDLAVVCREVITDLETRIEQVDGRVEIGDLPVALAEPLQMRQLFQNLIGNALKFHKPNESPVVKVHSGNLDPQELAPMGLDKVSTYCKIVVEDNGIGFDPRYAEKIFAVFQRLHGRDEYEGTGVGLAVCRKIAERHNGKISAHSRPGEGSVFSVILPRATIRKENGHDQRLRADHHPVG